MWYALFGIQRGVIVFVMRVAFDGVALSPVAGYSM